MKLTKIVSFITTVAMASAMLVSMSNIAYAATEPTLNVYSINVEENAEAYTDIDEKTGYDRYLVYYTLDGFDLSNDAFNGITIKYSVSDLSKVEASTFKAPSTRPVAKNGIYKTWDPTVAPFMFEEGAFNFQKSGGDGFFPYPATVTDYANPGESLPLIYTIWYVEENSSVDITYIKETPAQTYITTCPFDDASSISNEFYGNSLAMNVSKITLGESAPAPTPTPVPTTIEIAPATPAAIEIDGTVQLTATVKDQFEAVMNGQTVEWSSNSAAATVIDGLVTGKAAGTATITATCGDATASVTITVNEPAPPAYNFDEGTKHEYKDTAVKGIVWEKVKMFNVNTEDTFTAKFTASNGDVKENAIDLSAKIESEKVNFVFDVVLTFADGWKDITTFEIVKD